MKKGDLITAYHSGIHKVVNIQERWNNRKDPMLPVYYEYNENCGDKIGDLVTYTKVADTNGKPINSTKEYSCDIAFCNSLSSHIENIKNTIKQLEKLKIQYEKLK
jgi:hypothetical protein